MSIILKQQLSCLLSVVPDVVDSVVVDGIVTVVGDVVDSAVVVSGVVLVSVVTVVVVPVVVVSVPVKHNMSSVKHAVTTKKQNQNNSV